MILRLSILCGCLWFVAPFTHARGPIQQGPKTAFKNVMNPHRLPARGDHFEGWYHRVIDRENGLSIAVIATAYRLADSKELKGYLSLVISRDGQSPLSVERSEVPVTLTASGRPVDGSTKLKKSVEYRIEFPDLGYADANSLDISLRNFRVAMNWDMHKRLAWPRSRLSGLQTPADLAAYFPFLPAQWHVHDMGSEATYSIFDAIQNTTVTGRGEFHHEKNWGKSFPESWYWLDAMDAEKGVHVSGAGGVLKVLGLPIKAFLLGIHTPEVSFDFSPARLGARFSIESDGCENFNLWGGVGRYEFEIRTSAPQKDYVSLLVPKPTGYEPGAMETLDAIMELKIWRRPLAFPLARKTLIATHTLDRVGLEFGNEAAICNLR